MKENFPYKLAHVNLDDFDIDNTFSLNTIIDGLEKVHKCKCHQILVKGMKIAKVFRNKEGHVSVLWHEFDPKNYLDITRSIKIIYAEGFNEELMLRISIARNEKYEFCIEAMNSSM